MVYEIEINSFVKVIVSKIKEMLIVLKTFHSGV